MKPWKITWVNAGGLQTTTVDGDDLQMVLQALPDGIHPWEIVKVELLEHQPEVIRKYGM